MHHPTMLSVEVPTRLAGRRLDQALTSLLPDFSRSKLQSWIREGRVLVDGRSLRPRDIIVGGEQITVDTEPELITEDQAQPIPLDVRHQDDTLLVVNKPAGLVVHPAAGNRDGTLLNALLHHDPALGELPRAGIVHRLDKETSGLLMIARTLPAYQSLVRQLQSKTVGRDYLALVHGTVTCGGRIDAPIGRHPVDRKRFAVRQPLTSLGPGPHSNETKTKVTGRSAKAAVTHYRVLERFPGHTLLRVALETGRTHQIRVHMAYIGHPLVGDPLYGGRIRIPRRASDRLATCLRGFRRQALHAAVLEARHPQTDAPCRWQVDPPADLRTLLAEMRRWSADNPA